jgi:hypothetical protein
MKKLFFILVPIILLALLAFFLIGKQAAAPGEENPLGGSPFGSGEDINIPALGSETVGETTELDERVPENKLFRISNTPTAGFALIPRGTGVVVRYVERGSGHISEALLPREGEPLEQVKITNNTLPKIYEAVFRSDGLAVVLRSLEGDSDVVKNMTLSLTAPRGTSTSQLYSVTATNLRGNIATMAAGNTDTLFYVLKDSPSVNSSSFTGNNQRQLLANPFTDWRFGKLGNNLLLYTKASASAPGFAYSLPIAGGALTKLAGPLTGLTATGNFNGTRVLYSYSESGETKLFVKNIQSGALSEISPATLAEKCIWSSKDANSFFCGTPLNGISSNEPDNWYLGRTHFTDYIWKFNTATDIAELIAEPKTDFGVDLDVYEPKISANDDFLVFINKRDLTLWALRLN